MEIIFAGFGGQGVLTSGLVVANVALAKGKHVLWSPAYGGAMRGGKSFSLVKYSDEEIREPIATELDAVVVMNQPSLDFAKQVKEGGLVLVNSDVVDESVEFETKGRVVRVPLNTVAEKACGRSASANIVSIGALIKETGIFDKDEAIEYMCSYFEKKGKGSFNEGNVKALNAGYEF